MTLRTRLTKLETSSRPACDSTKVLFIHSVTPAGERECSHAMFLDGRPQIYREEGETPGAFYSRLFASIRVHKPMLDMTDLELAHHMAAEDEEAATELAVTGAISDKTINGKVLVVKSARWKKRGCTKNLN